MTVNITILLISIINNTLVLPAVSLLPNAASGVLYQILYLIFMSEPAVSRIGFPSAGLQ